MRQSEVLEIVYRAAAGNSIICPICMDHVGSDKHYKMCQECGQPAHTFCLQKWFDTTDKESCPACRSTFYAHDNPLINELTSSWVNLEKLEKTLADTKTKGFVNQMVNSRTALMQACGYNQGSGGDGGGDTRSSWIVGRLLVAGADVNLSNRLRRTALMCASETGRPTTAQALIDAGACVDYADVNGWTALMLACRNGHDRVALQLIEAKANVDKATQEGATALMFACQEGHDQCVLQMINAKANVDKTDENGITGLMVACTYGHDACVLQLINAKANVDHAAVDGSTALMAAYKNGHDACEQLLTFRTVQPAQNINNSR